jgi:asparagine synthase (glutamine-hydrolysing)
MVSDVPVGTLCSGGIDSGLVTAFATRGATEQLHSFSVNFPYGGYDESEHSDRVASALSTHHHKLDADGDAFADNIVALSRFHDEPLNHENSIFVYEVCKLARECGVIVLLTGEGADELFAGYPQIAFAVKLARYRHWGGLPTQSLWARYDGAHSQTRIVRWLNAMTSNEEDLVLYATSYMAKSQVERLLGQTGRKSFEYRMNFVDQTRKLSLPERIRWCDIALYLPPILMRQDKMSMAASVESRVPLLGNAIVDWSCRRPFKELYKGAIGKLPLRDLAYNYLPASVIDRPKVGFAVPFHRWLRESSRLKSLVQVLCEPANHISAYMDRKTIRRTVSEFFEGKAQNDQMIWILLALEIWMGEVLHG